jgi:hypothetical protein
MNSDQQADPWVCPWAICNNEQAQECRAAPWSRDACGRRFPPGTTLKEAKGLIGQPPAGPGTLDELFRENAIPMTDRNGRLYDAINASRGVPVRKS